MILMEFVFDIIEPIILLFNLLILIIMSKFAKAVSALRKADGIKVYDGLKITNVNISVKERYTQLALTLDDDIPQFIRDENSDEFILKSSNVIFTTLYSVNSVLRENDDAITLVDYFNSHKNALAAVLIGSKIDIIQQTVADKVYHNYFSDEDVERSDEYTTIFNHIVNIHFSKKAMSSLDKLNDKLLFMSDDEIE